jgi:hypothetical protein
MDLDACPNPTENARIIGMTDIEQSAPDGASNKVFNLLLRIVVSFNLLLIALGFTENAGPGRNLPEELFGHLRFGGLRFDFVWLFLSSGALFLATFFVALFGKSRAARVNTGFCIAGWLAFCIYIFYIAFSGVLDFG